jgi:hypothetical protein
LETANSRTDADSRPAAAHALAMRSPIASKLAFISNIIK